MGALALMRILLSLLMLTFLSACGNRWQDLHRDIQSLTEHQKNSFSVAGGTVYLFSAEINQSKCVRVDFVKGGGSTSAGLPRDFVSWRGPDTVLLFSDHQEGPRLFRAGEWEDAIYREVEILNQMQP